MLYHQHGTEGQYAEYHRVREQSPVRHMFQQETGQNWRDNLCCHGEGIIVAGIFADISAGADFHYHGERIDIYRCPGKSDDTKE